MDHQCALQYYHDDDLLGMSILNVLSYRLHGSMLQFSRWNGVIDWGRLLLAHLASSGMSDVGLLMSRPFASTYGGLLSDENRIFEIGQ